MEYKDSSQNASVPDLRQQTLPTCNRSSFIVYQQQRTESAGQRLRTTLNRSRRMTIKSFRKKVLAAAIQSTRHASAEALSLISVEQPARLISVLDKRKAMRFIEGRNTQEVLDFNLYLSPRDVWTRPLEE